MIVYLQTNYGKLLWKLVLIQYRNNITIQRVWSLNILCNILHCTCLPKRVASKRYSIPLLNALYFHRKFV